MLKRRLCALVCIIGMVFALGGCMSGGFSQDVDNFTGQSEPSTYTVTFKQAGYSDVVKTVNKGESLKDVPVPQNKTGYTVTWETVDFSEITTNMTVNAVEQANTYTITYDAGEGTVTTTTQEVVYDSTPTFAVPEREGYSFTGWTYEEKAVFGVWKIADNVTLVAGWAEEKADTYTVTFRQNGYKDKIYNVEKGCSFTNVPTPEAKEGYTVEWDTEDLKQLTNVTNNVVVEAVETAKTYTVTLQTEMGSLTTTEFKITFGEAYQLPTIADQEDYSFQGWQYNGENIAQTGTWNIDVDGNEITLEAYWVEQEQWTGSY